MTPEQIKKKRDEIPELNKQVVSNQRTCMHTKKISIPKDLWFELFDFELFLRKICKDSGLQIKMKEPRDIKGL